MKEELEPQRGTGRMPTLPSRNPEATNPRPTSHSVIRNPIYSP